MTPNHATLKIITAWVTRLADVCAHSDGKPSRDAIATYAAVLGQSHVSGAFTVESLAHVTTGREWFPAVSVVSTALSEWWRDHRPACAPMLSDGRAVPADWSFVERSWLDDWHKPGRSLASLDTLASLIRQQAPRVWEHINGPEPEHRAPSAEALEHIRRTVKSLRTPDADRPSVLRDVSLTREQLRQVREQAGINHAGVAPAESAEAFRQRHEAGLA